MKGILTIILLNAAITLMIYLAGSFIHNDLNSGHWHISTRLFSIIVWAVLVFCVTGYNLEKNKK